AKVHAARIVLAFEAAETIHEQVVVEAGLVLVIGRWNRSRPEAEGAGGRSLPAFLAVVQALEMNAFIDQGCKEGFSWVQFPAGDDAVPRNRLNLIIHHGRQQHSIGCSQSGASRAGGSVLSICRPGAARAG